MITYVSSSHLNIKSNVSSYCSKILKKKKKYLKGTFKEMFMADKILTSMKSTVWGGGGGKDKIDIYIYPQ